jgi:hypothetical protein
MVAEMDFFIFSASNKYYLLQNVRNARNTPWNGSSVTLDFPKRRPSLIGSLEPWPTTWTTFENGIGAAQSLP